MNLDRENPEHKTGQLFRERTAVQRLTDELKVANEHRLRYMDLLPDSIRTNWDRCDNCHNLWNKEDRETMWCHCREYHLCRNCFDQDHGLAECGDST